MTTGRERFVLQVLARLVPATDREAWVREWIGEADWAVRHRTGRAWGTASLLLAAGEDALRLALRRTDAGAAVMDDVRHAYRALRADRAYTLGAVATLAIGIGATAATFTLLDAYLLRPLPLEEPDRLFSLRRSQDGRLGPTSAPNFLDWRDRASSFEGMVGVQMAGATLTGLGAPTRVSVARVSPGFFAVVGARLELGRDFTPEEATIGRERVAVLGHDLWRDAFGADPGVLARTVVLDGETYDVVGVAARGVRVPPYTAQIWSPLAFAPDALESRGRNNIGVLARLAQDARVDAARAEMDLIAADLASAYPRSNEGYGIEVRELQAYALGAAPQSLWLLFGSVALVLLIACANVANLTTARGIARRPELAVRVSVGASRGQLLRQLLAESLIVAGLGGALGVVVAYLALEPMATLVPPELARIGALEVDLRVLLFVLAVSTLTGVLSGLAPGARLSGWATRSAARGSLSGVLRGRARRGTVAALVVGQFALAMLLLVGAGLLLRTLDTLYDVDLGLRYEGVSAFALTFPAPAYPEPADVVRAVEAIHGSLAARGDIDRATVVSHLPLSGSRLSSSVIYEGGAQEHGVGAPSLAIKVVEPTYHDVMEIPLLAGRGLRPSDDQDSEPVVVISEAAAEQLWPGEEAVGRWLSYTTADGAPLRRRVVGVVTDVRYAGPAREPEAEVYQSARQTTEVWRWFGRSVSFLIATPDGAAPTFESVQAIVSDVDPHIPVMGLRPLADVLDATLAAERFRGTLLTLFASAALLLAAVGMYGVTAFTVRGRTREVGIRLAVGAQRTAVLRDVLVGGARLAAAGVLLGGIAAFAAGRWTSRFLSGVDATDPATYATVAGVLALTTLVAAAAPALRAARVDPVLALRSD